MLVIVEPLEEDYIITCSRTRGFILSQIGSTSCISTKTIDDNNNKNPYMCKMRTKLRKGNSQQLLKEMLTLARCEGVNTKIPQLSCCRRLNSLLRVIPAHNNNFTVKGWANEQIGFAWGLIDGRIVNGWGSSSSTINR